MVGSRWRACLIEGALLALFMLSATAFTILLEHPQSPAHGISREPLIRRALAGAAMGVTAIALIYSPWGMRSGAHMNPAVTIAFLGLGKVAPVHAAGYVAAQFAGGLAGMVLARAAFGPMVSHPSVQWVTTRPGSLGEPAALAAEFVMTLILMTVSLQLSSRPRLAPYAGLGSAALVAIYIAVEAPLSGMSLNPARTMGPAVMAGDFTGLWIYFAGPIAGMAAAAELHARCWRGQAPGCARINSLSGTCLFRCCHP